MRTGGKYRTPQDKSVFSSVGPGTRRNGQGLKQASWKLITSFVADTDGTGKSYSFVY